MRVKLQRRYVHASISKIYEVDNGREACRQVRVGSVMLKERKQEQSEMPKSCIELNYTGKKPETPKQG
jgi:hypothetical protein